MQKVTKTCKGCGISFDIDVPDETQQSRGWSNILRREYHDLACKKRFSVKNAPHALKKSCKVCAAQFSTFPSVNSEYCSRKCKGIAHRGHRVERVSRVCETCKETFEVTPLSRRKFCSHECFRGKQTSLIELTCHVCGVLFKRRSSQVKSENAYCGRVCQFNAQSSGLIRVRTNGRVGKRADLGDEVFRSSFEADYARYCIFVGKEFRFQPETFELVVDGKKLRYTPDFYHPSTDEWVELKGVKKDSENAYAMLLNSNIEKANVLSRTKNLKVIYMVEFYQMLRDQKLFDSIPNLENRNYAATRNLICSN